MKYYYLSDPLGSLYPIDYFSADEEKEMANINHIMIMDN